MIDLELLAIVLLCVVGGAGVGAAAPHVAGSRGGAGQRRAKSGALVPVDTLLRVLCSLLCAFVAAVSAAATLPMTDEPRAKVPQLLCSIFAAFVASVVISRAGRGPLASVLADALVAGAEASPEVSPQPGHRV
jgi:hypothetical protein